MREILFRGKRLDNGEWVEGYLGQDTIIGNGKTWLGYVIKPIPEKLWDCDWFEVDPATVGQFTGLLDKNGKRIFEGDVCRFREWSRGEMCWIGNIHYENQQFVISGGPNKECETPFSLALSRFVSENIEVIGAIYDNSELLEVTPDA